MMRSDGFWRVWWYQKPAQWIVSQFYPHSAPEYFSGGTLPASAVIQRWPAQCASHDSCFSPWCSRMASRFFLKNCCLSCLCPENDLMPVARNGSVLCLFHTSHISLFLDFLFQKAIPHSYNCSQFLQDRVFVPLIKLLFTKETGEAKWANVFWLHVIPEQDLSLLCASEKSSIGPRALFWGFHPQYSGQKERYNQDLETEILYALWCHRALLIGREIWCGLETLTILSLSLPQSIGINPHCFQNRKRRLLFCSDLGVPLSPHMKKSTSTTSRYTGVAEWCLKCSQALHYRESQKAWISNHDLPL